MMVAYYVNMIFLPMAIAYVYDKILYKKERRWQVTEREEFWHKVLLLVGLEGLLDAIYVFTEQVRPLGPEEWFDTPIIILVDITIVCVYHKIKMHINKRESQRVCPENINGTVRRTEKLFLAIVIVWGSLVYSSFRWYEFNFNVSFEALLYTFVMPTEGTAAAMIRDAVIMIIPMWVLLSFVCLINAHYFWKKKIYIQSRKRRTAKNAFIVGMSVLCVVTFIKKIGIVDYYLSLRNTSQIYEEYYVKPTAENVINEKTRRNLILVYMESMENTYCDIEHGGENNKNYIPNLVALAQNNISFSNGSEMGGAFSCTGTGWTIAATIATTSGVPFAFPVQENPVDADGKVATGLVTMGDFLEKDGYNLEVIMGTNGSFAGEGNYYIQHGDYKVFDYMKILTNEYVPNDFYEWWGVRDEIVYRAAKDEITSLAEQTEPFAVSIFTMDTHNTRGYICPICKDEDDEPLGNVLLCADRQINEFVEWCQKQPFYEDTTIVIIGDHPRMDNYLVGDLQPYQRTTYNCIINGAQKEKLNTKNRCFTTLDYFPTILSSMGYQIKGDRLGLGTDLFSDTPTLSEEFGLAWLNEELAKKSKYYIDNFY